MSCGSFENEERTQLSLKLPWPGMAGHRAQLHAALAQQLLLITHWTKVLLEGVSQADLLHERAADERNERTNERKKERTEKDLLGLLLCVVPSLYLLGKKSGKITRRYQEAFCYSLLQTFSLLLAS